MELNNEFRVPVPPERAWEVLTDVERIAPCMPGAELEEVVDDEYRGVVRVKVGPITAQYKGVARFLDKDDAAHRAVLRAEGRETRGQGTANATITAQLAAAGEEGEDGTTVSVTTDLVVTGKVAQFGRGILADVSARLLDQFVACLEQKLDGGGGAGDGDENGAAVGTEPRERSPEPPPPAATPVDLLQTAGAPIAKRVVPIVAGVLVVLLLHRRRRTKVRSR